MPKVAKRNVPLTEKVMRGLRERLASGSPGPGDYLPSERELCRQLGVSRFTVRRALNLLVAEGLLDREPSRGYLVNREAGDAAAVNGKTGLLFLHSHPEEELLKGYHAQMWVGARMEASAAGLRVLITSLHGETLSEQKAREVAETSGGVLCDSTNDEWIKALLATGLQVIRVDNLNLGTEAPHLDTIIQDDAGGIYAAIKYLHGRGHRRIGYLDSCAIFTPEHRANALRRLGGYFAGLRRLELEIDLGLAAEVTGRGEASRAPTEKILAAGATALISPHAFLLDGVRAALDARGVKVPGDFGLVTWSDPMPQTDEETYPSYVSWSKEDMGREAVRRFILRLRRPEMAPVTINIPAKMVDRGTGGRGSAAKKRG